MIPGVNQPLTSAVRVFAYEVPIASGASQSQTIDLDGGQSKLLGIIMPAAWTAASLTFLVSNDGTTWYPLYYAGGEYTIAAAGGAAAGLAISLVPDAVMGWRFIKIRSGTAGTPVNQAADRTLIVSVATKF